MESHSCEKNGGRGCSAHFTCRTLLSRGSPRSTTTTTPSAAGISTPSAAAAVCSSPRLTSPPAPWTLSKTKRLNFAPIMPSASCGVTVPPKRLLPSCSPRSDFTDPPSVNRFLGNLLKLVAVKRVPRRDAVAMAYISQLILNSQAAQDRRELMRLQIADLDAQRQKNLPTRVIWDLPVRRKSPEQEADAGKAAPSEAPQPSPMPAAPVASASAHTDNHATEPLAPPAAPPPADRPAQSACPPAQTPVATSPAASTAPAPGAGVPAAAPGSPKPIPGFTLTREGHTTDWYAPASWNKPPRRRYPSSRWW